MRFRSASRGGPTRRHSIAPARSTRRDTRCCRPARKLAFRTRRCAGTCENEASPYGAEVDHDGMRLARETPRTRTPGPTGVGTVLPETPSFQSPTSTLLCGSRPRVPTRPRGVLRLLPGSVGRLVRRLQRNTDLACTTPNSILGALDVQADHASRCVASGLAAKLCIVSPSPSEPTESPPLLMCPGGAMMSLRA